MFDAAAEGSTAGLPKFCGSVRKLGATWDASRVIARALLFVPDHIQTRINDVIIATLLRTPYACGNLLLLLDALFCP